MLFTNYLFAITDDVGIFQHSIYGVPDLSKGYTTDDNSRALILAVMLFEQFKKRKYLGLIYKYLAFMLYAQNDDGKFKNFMNYNREFLEEEGSEDCFGRCLWALGRTISSSSIPGNIKKSCWYMINKALEHWPNLNSPRAKAYSIVGLSYLTERLEVINHIENLSMSLVEQYTQYKDGDWHWFEDSMTYGNAFFPWSLFKAFRILKKDVLLGTARESMDFLGDITLKGAYFKPVGCNGWLLKGKKAAEYDEQPIEACETLLSYLDYYEITKDKRHLDNAVKCFCWYTGQNSKGLSLIDEETGACYDGLNENSQNYNQGSESIISYGIAFMEISRKAKLITMIVTD
ncbi:MAG: glycosyltransferase [Clostridia bacterium]